MKKAIATFAMVMALGTSFAFANDGIIVAGRDGIIVAGKDNTCNQGTGIIVAGRDGIIVAGREGILASDIASALINIFASDTDNGCSRQGILVSD